MPNRLAAEQSPYLLQHAGNPVDWWAWGEPAFEEARHRDRPIFLSVGYATCHWCHVMERESFEDAATADVLNREFVPVKVDREERPDVDRVYMTFVQATTGSGGWPMSVWLTPELRPFFGGTYFPPVGQRGQPAFKDVLLEIARAWRDEREHVTASATQIVDRLVVMARGQGGGGAVDASVVDEVRRQFERSFDRRRGGFGDAPKFPRPTELLFLLREHARTGEGEAREIVLQTLRAMALGGLRDHVGGGFHRYSVDGGWRVPHFEKMLYDQAQLVVAYLEAAQVSGDPFFAHIAEDTLQYVARDMTDEAGGFYSAEDADSAPPESAGVAGVRKMEGAYYLWTTDEVRGLLGDASVAFELRYGMLPNGNAPFDPHQEFEGRNILYTARSIADIARETGATAGTVAAALMDARVTLFNARAARPRPERDDKILTGWNGLMIAAVARAARVLDGWEDLAQAVGGEEPGPRHLRAAEHAAAFIERVLWDSDLRVLKRRYRHGDAAIDGFAEDYAYLIWGLLELVQATGDARWLRWALELQQRQDELFLDGEHGGWFSTTGRDPSVLVRAKDEYDGAEPSATSVSAINTITLARLTGEASWRQRAERAMASFGARLRSQGRGVPLMAAAVATAHAPSSQIVVVGPRQRDDTLTLWRRAQRAYRPFTVMLPVEPGGPQQALADLLPWIGGMRMVDDRATAYVCREFACEAPTTTLEALS
ncbi:MAG: thioredoxin domain-containing protein [Acidobacteriota bacterium]|nr:thioredoxin domain-containing protein [Acidobacteriota bacterium]